ncbi:META domain-containing protein [Formosa sp. 4Alg 33]|uniref:META domain-containing protein n=1 Tax=Formosa sp. 4Alg 33 TaxID=3382189 RepID=UPI003D9C468C
MKFFKNSFVLIIFVSLFSCGQSKKETVKPGSTATKPTTKVVNTVATNTPNRNSRLFFKSSGAHPDWNLQLTQDSIKFSLNAEDHKFSLPEAILAADANVKMYRSETESAQIKIQISMNPCTDSDSKTQPYTVSIDFKQNTETDFKSLKGCGEYITDYRLHDIWVLESIKDETVSTEQFTKELPNLEINISENSFMGYAGCNTMRGSIFSEQSKIRFKEIIATRKMCPPTNKEAQFIKELERSTQFKIENRRLYLSNPDGNTLTFKKVD